MYTFQLLSKALHTSPLLPQLLFIVLNLHKKFNRNFMITVSKVIFHFVLAQKWDNDLLTRPNMRMKWGRGPMKSECLVGLWEHVVRNNPYIYFWHPRHNMTPGSKGCMDSSCLHVRGHVSLCDPPKHEEVAIFCVLLAKNERIPNVFRIVGAQSAEQSVGVIICNTFWPQHHVYGII